MLSSFKNFNWLNILSSLSTDANRRFLIGECRRKKGCKIAGEKHKRRFHSTINYFSSMTEVVDIAKKISMTPQSNDSCVHLREPSMNLVHLRTIHEPGSSDLSDSFLRIENGNDDASFVTPVHASGSHEDERVTTGSRGDSDFRYSADSECNSSDDDDTNVRGDTVAVNLTSSDVFVPDQILLPSGEKFLGLRRILQGPRFRRVLQCSYFVLIAVVGKVLLNVYAMFSPLSAASFERPGSLWKSLLHQSATR